MRITRPAILATFVACAVPGLALAGGDAEAGKAKSAACSICHGADGKAQIGFYPNLAGQNEVYLLNALKAYRNGDRKGSYASMMTPNVAALGDEDLADLAAYYHSLKP